MEPVGLLAATTDFAFPTVLVASLGGVLLILAAGAWLTARGRLRDELGRGVVLGLRGLLTKELRSRSRGLRSTLVLTAYLGALTLATSGFLALATQPLQTGGSIPPTIGLQLFSTLAVGSVLLLAFITPALTAGAVSSERERRTLDLLLVTQASTLGLVGGKLLGSLFYVLFLLLASLPAFALVYLFGGVPLLYLGMALAVAAVTALGHAALGLLLSAILRRTLLASVVAYLIVLGLVFGLPFVSAIAGMARQGQAVAVMAPSPRVFPARPLPPMVPEQVMAPPSAFVYVSPLLSLASVLPAGSSSSDLVGSIMRGMLGASGAYPTQPEPLSLTRSVYVIGRNAATGEAVTVTAWAPWVYHFLFSGAFTVFCLLVAALALSPVKPWRR